MCWFILVELVYTGKFWMESPNQSSVDARLKMTENNIYLRYGAALSKPPNPNPGKDTLACAAYCTV